MTQVLANVYIPGGRNLLLKTTPGRSVAFRGGNAKVVDHRDMPHVLALEDALVIPEKWAMGWADQWFSQTHHVAARVELPEDHILVHENQDVWAITDEDGNILAGPLYRPDEDDKPMTPEYADASFPAPPVSADPPVTDQPAQVGTWVVPETLQNTPDAPEVIEPEAPSLAALLTAPEAPRRGRSRD